MLMNQNILDYIKSQRIGVLAVELLDGSPHAATVHFAHSEEPLTFIFLTHNTYKKSEALLQKGVVRGSFVVGVDEDNMKTLQVDGEVSLVDGQTIKDIYFAKFPNKKEKYSTENDIFLVLKPTWWRFTDWTAPEGKTIITSE